MNCFKGIKNQLFKALELKIAKNMGKFGKRGEKKSTSRAYATRAKNFEQKIT